MGFFHTFWSWLSLQLIGYIGTNTAVLASTLEPTVIALATLYVMVWGYLHLTGRIEEPIATGLRRIGVLVVVLGVALHLWLYNTVIVDAFYTAPAQLASALVGASDPVSSIDAIWQQGGSVAERLWDQGGVLNGDFGFYLAGAAVWWLVGLLCVYTMFLIALASIASAILLAIGPLFVVMLLFDATRRFFEAWIAQLANYALVTVLTVLVTALLLRVVQSYAAQTAARGSALATVDALDMMLMVALVFLLMRQIMPIAAVLAGGLALSSFAVVSGALRWSAGQAVRRAAGAAALGAKLLPAAGEAEALPARAVPSWRDRL